MTRFNITLKVGVDFVIECFDKMWGGELFVPKIPSYRIVDLANSIAPDIDHRLSGIRPGEKLHEEMITKTDSMNTVDFGEYYVVLPSTQLWDINSFMNESNKTIGKMCEEGFSYNSGTNSTFLTIEEIKKLISENTN